METIVPTVVDGGKGDSTIQVVLCSRDFVLLQNNPDLAEAVEQLGRAVSALLGITPTPIIYNECANRGCPVINIDSAASVRNGCLLLDEGDDACLKFAQEEGVADSEGADTLDAWVATAVRSGWSKRTIAAHLRMEGETYESIATRLNISRQGVHYLLTQIPTSRRVGRPKGSVSTAMRLRREKMRDLRARMPAAEVAAVMGVSVRTVYADLRAPVEPMP